MKKKILFITTRNPYSGRYSGDVIRSSKIINLLRKKHFLDVVCLKERQVNLQEKNVNFFSYPNFFFKFLYSFLSLIKLKPLQFGLFFSKEMKIFIENNANNYDCLFFHTIRSSQYLPNNYLGKTLMEMGDLYSDNYFQTYKYLNFLNPLKYIYYLESLLVKKIEKKIFFDFDKTILFSENDSKKINLEFKKKIVQIDESIEKTENKFSFSKKNNRILFIGNLNYLPNLLACKDFISNILPKLEKELPLVKFSIIGNINYYNKFFISKKLNVELLGPKKNLSTYIKNSFCGLANLKIATGVQGKVLTYMSYGLPVICSRKVSLNFRKSVLSFKSNEELIREIIDLKKNKRKSNYFSKKSIQFSKKLYWKKVGIKYLKLLNF